MQYEIKIRMPLSGFSSAVKKLETDLNETMEGFGTKEKIHITSSIPIILTVNRELSEEEQNKMREIIIKGYTKLGEAGEVTIESFKPII